MMFDLPKGPPNLETQLRDERWNKRRPRRLFFVWWWCGVSGVFFTKKAAEAHRRELRIATDCDVWIESYTRD